MPPDAIREVQIETGTYTADLSGAGTGQVNVVTKSGTLTPHGSVYEYPRNSKFDPPEFTNPTELPPFSKHQFGGTLGGPAGHRFFFFGGYEGLRTTQHMSNIMSVPIDARRVGDFSGGAPSYDPLTTRANPAFNAALPISASNPQFIRTQFPDNKDSAEPDPIPSPCRSCKPTSPTRTSPAPRTTTWTRERTSSPTTASTRDSTARSSTARRCLRATA